MESSVAGCHSSRRAAVTIVLSLLVALLGAAFAPAASAATTYNVATAAELTAAIANAANGDSINVTANIVTSSEVTLNKSVTVQGNGFTISVPQPGVTNAGANNLAASAFRVFRVASPNSVTINNLAILGGNIQGAGLYNAAGATATLVGVTISNSRNSGGGGGGVFNQGTLYLSRSNLIRNSALYGGGFVNQGGMYIDGSSLSENRSESVAGGGGAGENQGALYANNSTFSQNQSTEIGGALNNYRGNLRILNSSFTGNVAYGSYSGGAIGNNGGNVAVANSLFAYNYNRTGGSVSNPTAYVLDDFGRTSTFVSGAGVSLAYSTYQATFPAAATSVGGNNQYVETSATPGTTGTNGAVANVPILFSGGTSSAITDPTTGLPIGVPVFRPLLVRGSGAYAGLALPTLGVGSWADLMPNRGTSSRFSTTLVSGLPVMGYYTKSAGTPAWVALTSTSPATNAGASGDLVASDEVGTARPDGTTGGAYTTSGAAQIQISNVYSVRSITTTTGGTVTGASVYGDVYPAGTSITVTALPDSGKKFKEWKVDGTACAVATCPPAYTFTVTANTTLEPVFEALPSGEYTVTYLANGASGGSAPPIATATNPTPVSIADAGSLTKTDYTFGGWNTAENGSGTAYAAHASYTGPPSLTLYAVWTTGVAPVNTVAPVVTGTATSGQTLSATAGTWTGSPAPAVAYQWQACTTADCVGGAVTAIGTNQNSYVLTGAEVGRWVRVQVTAANGTAPDAVTTSNITVTAVADVIPGSPPAPTAAAGDGQATVTVSPPTSGGTPTSYMITAHPGGATCTINVPATSCVVSGLVNGTSYTFTAIAANATGSSEDSPASGAITPTLSAVVSMTFVDLPTQLVPGQSVLFNLDLTASVQARSLSRSQRATAGVNGSATVKANGVVVCTAPITNGKGTCRGIVNATGRITFSADFNGSVAGVYGTATAETSAVASTASVAINRAAMRVGRCWVALTLIGRDAKAGKKITIWLQQGRKRIKLGTTRSDKHKAWTFRTRLNTLRATVWASDGTSSGAKLLVTVKTRSGEPPTVRGC